MTEQKLSMSFTSGTLLYHESITVAGLYAELGDWAAVREAVVAENRLQTRTLNTSKRLCREIASRLRLLTAQELALLRQSSRSEQNYLLWLAICKRYRFIYEFAAEVLREKFLRLDMTLDHADYDVFFNKMAEWHSEMEQIAPATRKKQRQFIFKMMREADLLTDDGRILPALFTPDLIEAIRADDPAHFAVFPISAQDIKAWA